MSPNMAASVRARLLNQAKQRGEEFERTLTRFAAERLLYRLGASAARERCLLKGASLLAVWLSDPYRATRDIDILASGAADDNAIRALVAEICAVSCPEDGLRFDTSGLAVETIRPEEEYSGRRARFQAFLGNARIAVQLDIGVGDAVALQPEEVFYPIMLPTLPPPRLRTYRRELTVAEKFEAMVKLDTQNSRMKDFHDLWALARYFPFEGHDLREAVEACFRRRATTLTEEAPRPLTAAFYRLPALQRRWEGYVEGGAILRKPPVSFSQIGEVIIPFLAPVWASIVVSEAFSAHWPAGGGWR